MALTRVKFNDNVTIDGNVGIGESNPGHKLHINGGSNDEARVRVSNTASGQASLDLNNSEGYFRTYTDAGEYRIYDQTDGAHRLVINTSGNVTTPNQPAFFAHRNGGNYTETTATAKVYIDGTRFNHGGHYDTTNNRFVAPVDGVYQFNASVNCYYISSGYQLRAFLYVNGSNYVVGDSFHSANNAHDLVASVSHVINLSANDYVEVWSFSDDGSRGFSSSVIWNTFSGYLIG
jgi:hypothetical protein